MLTRNEIAVLAKRRGLSPWQEEKRYVQALVLYSLKDQALVLKGGTYLWFFHGLDRFSDDLDFTKVSEFEEDLRIVTTSTTKLFGLFSESKPIKNDRYVLSFRVDGRGPLYTQSRDLCRVYVEVSKRDKVRKSALSVKLDEPLYGLPLVFLKGMDLSEVVAGKMHAVVRRRKAMDLYDLWYLLKRRAVPFDEKLASDKLSFYGTRFDVDTIEAILKQTKPDWAKELRPTVLGELPSHQEVRNDIWGALQG